MNAKVWRGETKLGEPYRGNVIDLAEQAEEYRTVAEVAEHLLRIPGR